VVETKIIDGIDPEDVDANSKKRVCIVTSEFVGLWKNGGIGTAMSGLAELLARAGHDVTVLYTRGHFLTPAQCRRWQRTFAQHGIALVPTRPRDFRGQAGSAVGLGFVIPAIVASFLRDRSFDVVHLNDTGGQGYLVAAARRFGLGFANTHVVVGLHGPTRWTTVLNGTPTSPLLQVVEQAEQVAVGCSDVVWSPSRYLVGWLTANGFPLPPKVLLQQYVLPRTILSDCGPKARSGDGARAPEEPPTRRLVFFGRLETRKGLGLFLDALDRTAQRIASAGFEVVFLGRIGHLGGERADVAICRRGAWPFAWRIESTLGQAESVAFLKRPGSLAVMASPEDNSPCTVYEAIEHQIPFIAAATGGIPEIIHADDVARVTFAYDERSLRNCLEQAIGRGRDLPVSPAVPRAVNTARWLAFHAAPERWESSRPKIKGRCSGIVAVVLANGRRAQALRTIDSLRRLGPALLALVVAAAGEMPFGNGARTVAPDQLREALARLILEHSDAAVLFVHAGAACEPERLLRMTGQLRPGEVDGLIPAAATTRDKIVAPLPFSTELSGIVDPLATGLMVLSAAAVATGIAAAGESGGATPAEIATAATAARLCILPYPGAVAVVPDRVAKAPRAARRLDLRQLAAAILCSPFGAAVPYAVGLAGAVEAAAHSLKRAWRLRRRSASP
jgi:glycosyltransferase involved in cell wall biosynthesis